MSLNLSYQFPATSFKMCVFEISTFTYRSCKLPQYSSIGRTVQPHKIVSKHVHQCADPRPAHGSDSSCCDVRIQTERMNVTDPEDRGSTKANGECPACKAAEEECLQVHIVKRIFYSATFILLRVNIRYQTRMWQLENLSLLSL